jgi:hypothetical protein
MNRRVAFGGPIRLVSTEETADSLDVSGVRW